MPQYALLCVTPYDRFKLFLLVDCNENVHSSDEPVEKSGVEEDNDFIHSCSGKLLKMFWKLLNMFFINIPIFLIPDLDTTVKEASANDSCLENTLSEDKSLEG